MHVKTNLWQSDKTQALDAINTGYLGIMRSMTSRQHKLTEYGTDRESPRCNVRI